MSETRAFHVPTIARSVQRQVLLPALLLASSGVLFLSGCSSSLNFKSPGTGSADAGKMHGTVFGGQAPVTGATVSLYEIGATATSAAGYAAALSTPLGTGVTDASGNFHITPTACTNAGDELYFVASGGMEIGNTTANTALVMTSVAGPCNAMFATQFVINEVTTVATEYALSGFSTDHLHLGTSTTNALGLTNAFATVTNLVNLGNGQAQTLVPYYASNIPANTTPDVFAGITPYDMINTLANIMAACVNAAGGASDPACTNLFSFTGGANSLAVGQNGVQGPVATNTADAALYIAHNPGLPASSGFANNNVAAVWGLPSPQAPFGPVLAAAPNDWSMTLSFVSGGIGGSATTSIVNATQLAVDTKGGVWIRDVRFPAITSLNNLGTPLSPTTQNVGTVVHGGYQVTGLTNTAAIKLDTDQNGNVWTADPTNCLVAIGPTGTALAGSPFTAACPSTSAETVTVDGSNNVWVGGNGPSFVAAVTNPAAAPVFTPVTGGLTTVGHFMVPDQSGNVWFTDGINGDFVTSTGSLNVPYPSVFGGTPGVFAAFGIGPQANPGTGNALVFWVPQPSVDDVQPVNGVSPFAAGTPFLPPTGQGEVGIQADGLDRFIWANGGNTTLTPPVPPNITVYLPNETQVSPISTGYTGGSALMVLSNTMQGMAIDQSGNLWVVSQSNLTQTDKIGPYGAQYVGNGVQASVLTEFIGLAGPSQPVNALNAKNHTYGVKP